MFADTTKKYGIVGIIYEWPRLQASIYKAFSQCLPQNLKIERQRPILDIVEIILKALIDAKYCNIVPDGDASFKQCNYCPAEFKTNCPEATPKMAKVSGINSLSVMKAIINKYRSDNTPEDDW